MQKTNMILVDDSVLPNIFLRVLGAKQLLQFGEVNSIAIACSKAGISRSAYYKYKDHVFAFDDNSGRLITIHTVLLDRAGILSEFISVLYENGANILTVNQDIPTSGRATVSVSFRVGHLKISVNDLINQLKSIDGVKSIERISGEY